MDKNAKILVVGHDDIIENSLFNYFQAQGFRHVYSSSHLPLEVYNQNAVEYFFEKVRPDYVFLGSTQSGGIMINQKHPAEFIYSNLESQNNIIHMAYRFEAKKLVFFAGSCIYPKKSPQPIKEEYLLTGSLEETSEPYSIAKIAGVKMCQSYKRQYGFNAITVILATVYGPGSDVNIETAHVIGALIGKFSEAALRKDKKVTIWGSGRARREFIYTDDFVDATVFLMKKYDSMEVMNVGCGKDVSVAELAGIIKDICGFRGDIEFDKTKPDGTMKKLMSHSRLKKLGWKAKIDLKEGIKRTYEWYTKKLTAV